MKKKIKSVLIANRGEIAVRIARACRDFGAKSVAIYSEQDFASYHTKVCDEAFSLEGNTLIDTYLNINKIIDIAKRANVDAIHAGYGFLSENADFAQAVIDAGFIWIGPAPTTIKILGDKIQARNIAISVGAPLAKGTNKPVENHDEIIDFAKENGLPIIIKAAHGGGGRGMKIVYKLEDIKEQYELAQKESMAAFGRAECFVEQFLENPRHIEVQIIADNTGNIEVLGTRECSMQRRNQKLIEEAPAPFINSDIEDKIKKAAKDICKKAGYINAGTVEFLLAKNGLITFLEVNTRLQVEHTVTEESTGIDIVLEQLNIASGNNLSIKAEPKVQKHAIEFRINAEDAARGFIPATGKISKFTPPAGIGVRLDSGFEKDSVISPAFDSLMAKLIVTGANRNEAINRAKRALKEFEIEGVPSTINFFNSVLNNNDYLAKGDGYKIHTNWIEKDFINDLIPAKRPDIENIEFVKTYIEIDGKLKKIGLPTGLLQFNQGISDSGEKLVEKSNLDTVINPDNLLSPIDGSLSSWKVSSGDRVEKGDFIAIIEAMKIEMQITAHKSGVINIKVAQGNSVSSDEVIAEII